MVATTFNQALEAHTRKLIETRINELGRTSAAGNLPDYPSYKYNCGIIKGLNEALDILDQSLTEIQTAGRGDKNAKS